MKFLFLSAIFVANLTTPSVLAAEQNATFSLHPHCIEREAKDDDWVFGPIPAPGMVANTRGGGIRCSEFEVLDPQTVQTRPLRKGDTLDIDLVINNPDGLDIERVRAWLIYDPNLLEGKLIDISEKFPLVTPGENDFSPAEGYAKMEASADGNWPDAKAIFFARLQFTVLETNNIGTPISFHDVQPNGRSVIVAHEGQDGMYIVKEEPGTLLVQFAQGSQLQEGEEPPQDTLFDTLAEEESLEESEPEPESEPLTQEPDPLPEPEVPEDDNSCLRNEDCPSGICTAGQCAPIGALLPNGEQCSQDSQCESGLCGSGVCVPNLRPDADTAATEESPGNRTAFSLLQIRNVRVTTDGSSAFLAWDPLQSSQLKAYNVYYSRTSGKYIQRRTIDKTETSLTIRSLPLTKRHYFAVRGLSTKNEESAFSQEVSIVIGDPDSSTAPLALGSIRQTSGKNPVASISGAGTSHAVPGETGIPSFLLFFLVGSAVIGTSFAARRQLSMKTNNA